MAAEIVYSCVCACCGHRSPHNIMQIGLTYTIDQNILERMMTNETERIKCPSRIRLSTSSNDYVIHNSYIRKKFLIFVMYVISL